MAKKHELGSFLKHPQIKTEHKNAESGKLCNHDTDGSGGSSPAPSGNTGAGSSDTPDKPAPITGGY